MNNIQEWLNSEPLPDEIRIKDEAKYIPYHIIVDKLNKLCIMGNGVWHTKNFSHLFYTLKNGKTIVSGSIDVVVEINGNEGWFAGAATFALSKSSNPHPAASVKSLAVMNAVKPLGKQFGWGLNGFENESVYFPEEDVPDVFEEKSEFEKSCEAAENVEDLAKLKIGITPAQTAIYMKHLKRLTGIK